MTHGPCGTSAAGAFSLPPQGEAAMTPDPSTCQPIHF